MTSGYRYHPDPAIDAAIQRTFATHPYYASAVLRLRIVATPEVPTMATSADWVTHYNQDTVRGWTVNETSAVLVHELEHLLRDHAGRCGHRDPKGWNVAADAEINQRLPGLPDGAVYPETLGLPRGRSAEVYYGASGQDDKSDDGTAGDGAPGDGPNCGSAAGGPTQAHEAGDAANPGEGAKDGGKNAKRKVAQDVLQSGIGVGTEPGEELRDWAEAELGIDRSAWYGALAAAVGHTLAPYGAPTRWRWPGRRDMRDVGGAMLPRWTGERPSCAVVIDTSSSITPFDLEMARAAGHFIGRMADVTYYGCDTHATNYGSTMPERISGGGGTNLVKGIEMAIEDGARAVVVITDCMTPWPEEPTSVPVIIGANPTASAVVLGPNASKSYRQNYTPPEWMTVLPIVADQS